MAKYHVLDLFYASKEWKEFRRLYVQKRLIQDRGSMCDFCGDWIDKPDDIVLHHIEELTPDNVHIAEIAFGENNIKQVHKACHNVIHRHAKAKLKRVYIVYGPPCSGKTTYVLKRRWEGDLIVDMDKLFQAISLEPLYTKPDVLAPHVFCLRDLLIDNIKTRYGRWDSAWVIGGYPDKYKRNKLAEDLGAEIIYIETEKDECIRRLSLCPLRSKHKKEWEGYINKWFDRYTY